LNLTRASAGKSQTCAGSAAPPPNTPKDYSALTAILIKLLKR
jgi:hypothetical protein